MATVKQRRENNNKGEEADEDRKGNSKLSACLKALLVIGEILACLGMIYIVFDYLVVKRTFMSYKYMNMTLDNQTSNYFIHGDNNETTLCTDSYLKKQNCLFTINPSTDEGKKAAVDVYDGNNVGDQLDLRIYIIYPDNKDSFPINAVCGDSVCIIKRNEDHPTIIFLAYFCLQIGLSFVRLFLEFESLLQKWKEKHDFDKVWCCKCCGNSCKRCQCTKHDCFKNIMPLLFTIPNNFLANTLQNSGAQLYEIDDSSGLWFTKSNNLTLMFTLFYILFAILGAQVFLLIVHRFCWGKGKDGDEDSENKKKRCCCVALCMCCCKCYESLANLLVGTSLLVFLIVFLSVIFIENILTEGIGGILFSSPLPVSVPGPPSAAAFANMNVVARFIYYGHAIIPMCASCAGIKAARGIKTDNATKRKLPRLSQVKRAESANEDMQAMEEQREKRQQRKKEKDEDENNQTDFVNPLIQQQQQQQSQPQQMLVTCPPHLKPGQAFKMKLTNGSQLRVVVPQGIRPGMNFSVALPR